MAAHQLVASPPEPAPPLAHISTQVTAFQRLTGPSATPPYCFQALVDHTVGTLPGDMISDLVGVVTVGFGGHIAAGQEVCHSPPTGGDDSFWGQLTSVVNTITPNILAEIIPGCDDTDPGVLLTVEKAALTAVGCPHACPTRRGWSTTGRTTSSSRPARPADDDPSLPYPKAICVNNTSSPVTPPG